MPSLKERLGHIIFETNTPAAKTFDIALLWAILISVMLVMIESVTSIRIKYGTLLRVLEWFFTALFTLEYAMRVFVAYNRRKYIFSFFGLVDLLAVIPTYLSLFIVGSQYLIVVRALRLLRVFRVLKLVRFLGEASTLGKALKASQEKITVFIVTVLTLVTIIGSVMFLVEGPENGFTNIPISIYWAIVTLTTVGYGDIAPRTPLGQFLSAIVMILGFAIIAVPTGIVSAELNRAERQADYLARPRIICHQCGQSHHLKNAVHCHGCGAELEPPP